MKRIAQKWNFEKEEYKPYELPEGASMFETDMEKIISCGDCGKKIAFGDCFTSRAIHTKLGLGYGVCESCYADEWDRDRKSKK